MLVFLCLLSLMITVNGQGLIPGVSSRCFEPKAPGVCRAFIPSFYFNPLSGICDCFVFGGCRGNGNNFQTLSECVQICNVQPELQTVSDACKNIFRRSSNNPFDLSSLLQSSGGQSEEVVQELQSGQGAAASPSLSPSVKPNSVSPSQPEVLITSEPQVVVNPFEDRMGNNPSISGGRIVPSIFYTPGGTKTGQLAIGAPVLVRLSSFSEDDD